MAKESGELKRHFPRMNKFLFCFPLEKGTKIMTLLLMFVYFCMTFLKLVGLCGDFKLTTLFEVILYTAILISIAVFYLGINLKKLSFIKQFLVIYLLAIIYYLALYSYIYYEKFTTGKDVYVKKMMEKNAKNDVDLSRDELIRDYYDRLKISLVAFAITVIISIYYFFVCGSYYENVKEIEYEEEKTRNLENNN